MVGARLGPVGNWGLLNLRYPHTHGYPFPLCQVLEKVAVPGSDASDADKADSTYWWTKFMDAGGLPSLWRVVRDAVPCDALDVERGTVFAAACVSVAAKLLDYAYEVGPGECRPLACL